VDLTIDLTDLLKSFLVAFAPVLTVFLDLDVFLEAAEEEEDLTYTYESSSCASLFWL